jgi:hypothetical protein
LQKSRSLEDSDSLFVSRSTLVLFFCGYRQNRCAVLIGIDVQKAEQIYVSASTKALICRRNGSTIPLDDDGHLVLRWPIGQFKTYYTKPQLQRLHRPLMHPSSKKLYELLRRARPEYLPPETRSMIDDITRACETCATWDRRPTTFRIPDIADVVFNQELSRHSVPRWPTDPSRC